MPQQERWIASSQELLAMTAYWSWCWLLKLLHPRPQFQFPGPGAARLLQHVPVALRDGVGIEHGSGPVGGLDTRGAADAAVDHEMRDMDALRRQFARHALRQAAQRELAHRKRRRLRIALDAGGGAGEQDRAVFRRQHSLDRLLRHQEAAEGADADGVCDFRRYQVGKGAARPRAGVIDHDVGGADLALHQPEQALDLFWLGGVAGKGAGAGLVAQRAEFFDLPRGECEAD